MRPYNGGQAEYLRVPYADYNCLKLPADAAQAARAYEKVDHRENGWTKGVLKPGTRCGLGLRAHEPNKSRDNDAMTVHNILKMGDVRLLRVAVPVSEFDTDALHLLITDMVDTMRAANGAGLAAPQIGVDLQLVIFGTDTVNPRYPDAPAVPRTVLLNPVITPQSGDEEDGWEGCLSVPGMRGVVPRWSCIRYTGFDQYGDPIDRTVDGFHARVVQHECDHLIGKLYPMRMRDFAQFGFTEELFPGLDASADD